MKAISNDAHACALSEVKQAILNLANIAVYSTFDEEAKDAITRELALLGSVCKTLEEAIDNPDPENNE